MAETMPVTQVRNTQAHDELKSAFEAWLATLPGNTSRAYRQAWASLMGRAAKAPAEIVYTDVARWVEWMKATGTAASTINLRLAGISAFYQFYADATRQPLLNPASGKALRQKCFRWQGAHYLDAQTAQDLLAGIDRSSVRGARDYALILAYLLTGRRNSEMRQLRWGDIETISGKVFYQWQGKGKARRDLLPDPVYQAIKHYCKVSGRMNLSAGEAIFVSSRGQDVKRALSACQVGRLLNGYLTAAGIEGHYRVHDLRHTAAMLRKAAGADIETISGFLNHSNVNTTMTYLHSLEGHADESWAAVWAMLGVQGEIHNPRIAKKHGRLHRE